MDELQTLISFNHLHDATFATGLLEAEGIYYMVDDVSGTVFTQTNRVRVKVFSRDLQRASAILYENGLTPIKPASISDNNAVSQEMSDEEFDNRFKYSAFADPEPDMDEPLEMEAHNAEVEPPKKKPLLESNPWLRWAVIFILIKVVLYFLRN